MDRHGVCRKHHSNKIDVFVKRVLNANVVKEEKGEQIMSIQKRKIVAFLAAMCVIIGSMSATFAASNVADLAYGQKWEFSSGAFAAKTAYIQKGGWNSGDSAHRVYFINAVYNSSSDINTPSKHEDDTLMLVSIGGKVPYAVKSSTFSSKKYFRLLLNPYGTNTTECRAHGEQADHQ